MSPTWLKYRGVGTYGIKCVLVYIPSPLHFEKHRIIATESAERGLYSLFFLNDKIKMYITKIYLFLVLTIDRKVQLIS